MTRSAISPRQAIATQAKGGLTSRAPAARGTRRCPRGPPARRAARRSPRPRAPTAGRGRRRAGRAISALAARTACRAAAQHRRERALDGARRAPLSSACTSCTRPIARACSASNSSPVRKSARACERPMRASANGRDRRRDQPQSHLGEAEARVLAREHDVAAAGEAGAAAERGAVHARDHGHRAAVDGREHGRGALGVGDVALVRELAGGAHPLEVGAGAERGAAPRQHDCAQGLVRRERRERLVHGRDQVGVEGVAPLGPVEPHPRDAALALERETAHIRKTPKRGSGIGARAAAARPSASTRRVSRGSITPSSHRRAVE